jgi:hypothetical protein
VVLQVDKARVLEAFEDGVGGLLLRIGIAREKGGEVDELGIIRCWSKFLAEYKVPEFPGHPARRLSLP